MGHPNSENIHCRRKGESNHTFAYGEVIEMEHSPTPCESGLISVRVYEQFPQNSKCKMAKLWLHVIVTLFLYIKDGTFSTTLETPYFVK